MSREGKAADSPAPTGALSGDHPWWNQTYDALAQLRATAESDHLSTGSPETRELTSALTRAIDWVRHGQRVRKQRDAEQAAKAAPATTTTPSLAPPAQPVPADELRRESAANAAAAAKAASPAKQ